MQPKRTQKFCLMCGALFDGIKISKYCPSCAIKARQAKNREWYKKNEKTERAKKKERYEAIYGYGKKPEIKEENFFLGDEQRYCSAYDGQNLACIKCFENQTAEYKGCYKK